MKILTKKQQESDGDAKICYICNKRIENKYLKEKRNIVKLEVIVVRQRNTELLRIANVI